MFGEAAHEIGAREGFALASPVHLSLFTFRLEPRGGDADAATRALAEAANGDGRIYVTLTEHEGRPAIRFQVGQFDCTRDDVMAAVEVLDELARALR